jgi:uncharacterized repeat protein (TIGR03803 family)
MALFLRRSCFCSALGNSSTTEYGGAGYGTVYQIDSAGDESVLYSFQGGTDGANPTSGLLAIGVGDQLNFYGVATAGGANGNGVVFGITAAGTERVVHSFNGLDGSFPLGRLIRYKKDLFGVTEAGGIYNAGTVFKVLPGGKEEVVYSFTGGIGGSPEAGLIEEHGQLYGTTSSGGEDGDDVVFTVEP